MAEVSLKSVVKQFGDVKVIHGIDLQIEDGEFCVFVGPSGCGKSTLLRMVAGLEDTTSGAISIGARDVTLVDPAERGIAMVFQTYALYPHMTVAENMGFGLKMTGHPAAEVSAKDVLPEPPSPKTAPMLFCCTRKIVKASVIAFTAMPRSFWPSTAAKPFGWNCATVSLLTSALPVFSSVEISTVRNATPQAAMRSAA